MATGASGSERDAERTPLTGGAPSMGNRSALRARRAKFAWAARALLFLSMVLVIVWFSKSDVNPGFSWASGSPKIFNYHPVFMTLGFIVCGTEAALAFQHGPGTRPTRKKFHVVLHTAAVVFATIGIYAVFKFHADQNIPDMYSLHSWIGLAVYIIFLAQFLSGFSAFWWPGLSKALKVLLLPIHAKLGLYLTCALVPAVALLGTMEKLGFRAFKKSQGVLTCDADPMPLACRAGNWFGVCVVGAAACAYVAIVAEHKSERARK